MRSPAPTTDPGGLGKYPAAVGDVDVDATGELRRLTERFGSPLYVYRLNRLVDAHADLCRALPQPSTLYYSLKANPHPDIVRALLGLGCRAEVSSVGELEVVLAAGGGADDCIYTGPGKSDGELDVALLAGVRRFSCESQVELARLDRAAARHSVEVGCLLRVNVDRAIAGSGLRMTGTASQFGTDLARLLAEPAARTGTERVRVEGAHFHTGTNVWQPDGLVRSLEAYIDTAARVRERCGLPLRQLDLGGGFAAPFARPGARQRYGFERRLSRMLDARVPDWRLGDPQVAFESGRYLVAEAGELLCTVVDVKRSKGRLFAVLDAGVNHLGGLSGLGRLLPMAVTPVLVGASGREPATVDLVGPLCTPADVLGRDVRLPLLAPGDTVAIPNVGAYGLTASLLAFLGRPAPVEVVLRDGVVVSATRLVVHRDDMEEAG